MNFNLTDWALRHRAFVLFLIVIVAVAGAFSFAKLGQLEDPKFSVPSMTAMVAWPGSSSRSTTSKRS
jgi:multidrug efflux pump subunit AcrB